MVVTDEDPELYRKYGDELVRFASAVVGPGGAEDVVATAVLRCFATPGWPSVGNRRAYLYRAVLNQAVKMRNATEWRLDLAAADSAAACGPDAGVGVDVIRAMRRLTERQRAVLYLSYWEDLSPPDIADALRMSLRTVQRELTAGRTRLRRLLS